MGIPAFHITIDGPAGMTFRSFPSTDLENGDPTKILLAMVRNTCRIISKSDLDTLAVRTNSSFTLDGKSRIDDNTTLAYYMSLTLEGQKILPPLAPTKTEENAETGENGKDKTKNDVQATDAGVSILTLKVSNGKAASSDCYPLALPASNDALAKLLKGFSKNTLKQGELPTFTDRELSSLKSDYSVVAD
ncbi:unnamed protein product [Fusarium equiseti]|uniref:Uncharacterized protein n=1 Tax=Fusarium equiseti TaxID=61235 RepID=A0A8J2IKL1_FUSEQ|nr:unnamed protein product [Fusarium equiseti]